MGPWKSRVGGFAFEIEKLDEGMSGGNTGGGSELVAVWMEGESKNTAGKGVGFLVTAPLVQRFQVEVVEKAKTELSGR